MFSSLGSISVEIKKLIRLSKCSPVAAKVATVVSCVVAASVLLAILQAGKQWSHLSTSGHSRDLERRLTVSATAAGAGVTPTLTLPGDEVIITPERLPLLINHSDIYVSLLTAPVYHEKRFALQYLTWLQTVDPKHIRVVTDSDDNRWIQAFKARGGNVVISDCPISKMSKSKEMMCCKTGVQFDYWYRAREAGNHYKWYCHIDDDLYLNMPALVDTLKRYNSSTDCYLGNWKVLEKVHKYKRIPATYKLAPKLTDYVERKRNDFQYASGNSYCISEALMMKVEKYLRGKNFEENCKKSQVLMDDILPGVIIDGVLGVDLKDTEGFKGQMDDILYLQADDPKERFLSKMNKAITIGMGGFVIKKGAFSYTEDHVGIFSYHCLLYPSVSWCKKGAGHHEQKSL